MSTCSWSRASRLAPNLMSSRSAPSCPSPAAITSAGSPSLSLASGLAPRLSISHFASQVRPLSTSQQRSCSTSAFCRRRVRSAKWCSRWFAIWSRRSAGLELVVSKAAWACACSRSPCSSFCSKKIAPSHLQLSATWRNLCQSGLAASERASRGSGVHTAGALCVHKCELVDVLQSRVESWHIAHRGETRRRPASSRASSTCHRA